MINISGEEKQFHIKVSSEDVGKYVILCGDPGRVEKIAEFIDNAKEVSFNREYKIYTGYLCGEKVSVASTGIGGPSAAICVEELSMCGCHTFIRVGTSGGMGNTVNAGDLIIATAAIRDDGTSREYMPAAVPAVANFDIVRALYDSADKNSSADKGNGFLAGVVQSKDSFYGETNPETMATKDFLLEKWDAYIKLGCLCSEMECASIFSVAMTRNLRAGAVLLAIWNVTKSINEDETERVFDTTRAISVAIDAMKELITKDRNNEK